MNTQQQINGAGLNFGPFAYVPASQRKQNRACCAPGKKEQRSASSALVQISKLDRTWEERAYAALWGAAVAGIGVAVAYSLAV